MTTTQDNDVAEKVNTAVAKVFPLALADDFHTLPYLSLGMVIAYLRAYNNGTLQQGYSLERLRIGGVAGHTVESAYADIATTGRCICLLSCYVWNKDINLATAPAIKAVNPGAVVIIGGPEVPKYVGETELFLRQNPAIDIAVLGEGEITCAEILARLQENQFSLDSLRDIPGLVYQTRQGIVRSGERQRLKDVNDLPSPYLTGEFEPWFQDIAAAILETNRGCPYGCTYCDWGSATLQKVSKFTTERVLREINYIADKRSQSIFIADANFGMLEQDIEIALAIVAARKRTGFPQRLSTNFAKNGGRRLMAVIKILHEGGLLPTGIIALQTTDPDVLKAIQRDNIKTESYEKLMAYFNAEHIPMASDIMIGLPGQTIDSLQRDLQFCFDWKVSANGNYTSMMPNAPMAEKQYRKDFNIVVDDAGLIASTSTFTQRDLAYMKSLFLVYQFHVKLGVLRYYLYYLQLEHSVSAIALLRRWLDAVAAEDPRLPISIRLYREVFNMQSRSGDWALISWGNEADFFFASFEHYCDEFHQFVLQEYALTVPDSAFECIKSAQATVMPRLERKYPYRAELPHNIVQYFRQLRAVSNVAELKGALKPLHKYPSGKLSASPFLQQVKSIKYSNKIDGHSDGWELRSLLRFAKPTYL